MLRLTLQFIVYHYISVRQYDICTQQIKRISHTNKLLVKTILRG